MSDSSRVGTAISSTNEDRDYHDTLGLVGADETVSTDKFDQQLDRPTTSHSETSSVSSKGALGLQRYPLPVSIPMSMLARLLACASSDPPGALASGDGKTSKSGMRAAMWAKKTLRRSRGFETNLGFETKEQVKLCSLDEQLWEHVIYLSKRIYPNRLPSSNYKRKISNRWRGVHGACFLISCSGFARPPKCRPASTGTYLIPILALPSSWL